MLDKIGKHCNCTKKECVAPDDTYECCSQKVRKGKPMFGLWVKKNECDEDRGLPKNAHMHNNKSTSEGYISGFKEGYDNDDDNDDDNKKHKKHKKKKKNNFIWKLFLFMVFIIIVGIVVVSIQMLKNKKNNL
jgi:hypothetical protein